MTPVSSSNVAAVGYHPDFRRLYVRFKNGQAYRYEDVPAEVYRMLMVADSKGGFIHRVIRGNGSDSIYAYSRV